LVNVMRAGAAVFLVLLGGVSQSAFAHPEAGHPYFDGWKGTGDGVVEKVIQSGTVGHELERPLQVYLAANQLALDEIVKLTGAEEPPRFEDTPDFKMLRQACQALTARGFYRAHSGNLSGAVGDWLAVCRWALPTARGTDQQPELTDVMLGNSLLSFGIRGLSRFVSAGRLPVEQAKTVLSFVDWHKKHPMPPIAEVARADGEDLRAQMERQAGSGQLNSGWQKAKLPEIQEKLRPEAFRKAAVLVQKYFDRLAQLIAEGKPLPDPKREPPATSPEGAICQHMLKFKTPNYTEALMKIKATEDSLAALAATCRQVSPKK
jgi:hypothetical protein